MSTPEREPNESLVDFARRRAEHFGYPVKERDPMSRQPDETVGDWVARRKAARGDADPEPTAPAETFEPDLVPDVTRVQTRDDLAIDAYIRPLSIVDAYNSWCGKMHVDPQGKTEGILVRCPNPRHEDNNPSSWLTLDKGDGGLGNCAICGGFDKYDIAAWRLGYDVPGYKRDGSFPELRRMMARALGWRP